MLKCVLKSLNRKESSPYDYHRVSAVLTVEAAAVVPMFLMAMISLVSILNIIHIDMKLKEAVYEEAKYVSMISFDNQEYGIDGIRKSILSSVGNKILESSFIDKERGGIDFSYIDNSDSEILNINVVLNIKIPFWILDSLDVFRFRLCERAVVHKWVGYEHGLSGMKYSDEVVFITEKSDVYHRSLECTHLKLSITDIDIKDIDEIRNLYGEKYKKCELCCKNNMKEKAYITREGNRYHTVISCSGLKRTVKTVRLYEVYGRRPCLRCGY